ncbi:hypothetical protein R6Q57_006868 [Mikania cordata]
MSFWDESFFNYFVPDLNEEPPVEYSYGTIDLNAEPNADVGLTVKHRMVSCMTTVNKVTWRRVMKKSRRLQTLTGKPKSLHFITAMDAEMPHQDDAVGSRDTSPIAARVAAVRASVSGGDEVSSYSTDEHGDAPLYRLGRPWRLRGGGSCESHPRRGHPVNSLVRPCRAAYI